MRTLAKNPWNFLIDLVFPPSKMALELRAIYPADILDRLPRATPPPFPFITSLFTYKNPLTAELVWSIKYKKDRHAIELGGYALYKKLQEMAVEKTFLIPIPISKKRRGERGYNQCELLVNEIIKLDTEKKFEKSFDLLVRVKHTERQTLKNRQERLMSTESIFNINQNLPDKDAPIIIIDDVTTTGSTLKEAYEVLVKAGYTNVRTLTLAH